MNTITYRKQDDQSLPDNTYATITTPRDALSVPIAGDEKCLDSDGIQVIYHVRTARYALINFTRRDKYHVNGTQK